MKLTWILVADKSRARIFEAEKRSSIREIEDIAHPESRLHAHDLTSDLPGRNAGKDGAGGHAFQDHIDPQKQEAIDFANSLAKHLENALHTRKFKQLILIAAPSFLGILRNQLSDELNQRVCFELDKNLTKLSVDDIREHLPKHFPGSLSLKS